MPTGAADTKKIAVVPGDGIGPEVTEVALEVLEKAAEKIGQCRLEWVRFPWGSDYYIEHGVMMPSDGLKTLGDFDAIYLGAIGDPRVPDHISLELLLAIRKGFDQYVNLRPIKLLEGVESPIRIDPQTVIDFVVVRENTEGEYSRLGGRFKQGTDEETAIQLAVFSRKRTREVIRYAFELARKRQAKSKEAPRPLVTNCTKSNALNFSAKLSEKAVVTLRLKNTSTGDVRSYATQADPDTSYSWAYNEYSKGLEDGIYNLAITARDEAGNISEVYSIEGVRIDRTFSRCSGKRRWCPSRNAKPCAACTKPCDRSVNLSKSMDTSLRWSPSSEAGREAGPGSRHPPDWRS